MINERYPGTNTSKVTKEVFPNVIVKHLRVNGVRSTYYIGIRKRLATNTSSINEQQLFSISSVSTPLPLASVLECEIQKVLSSNGMVVHGPDSPEHLHAFSIQGLIEELKQLAPTLLDLFASLGDTKRNSDSTDPDETETRQDMKALFSLSTLLNARSQKVKGFQLFISMMLIARATNKQVCWFLIGYVHIG